MIHTPFITDDINQIYGNEPYDKDSWIPFCPNWIKEIVIPIEEFELIGTIVYEIRKGNPMLFFFLREDWPIIKEILKQNDIEYYAQSNEIEKIIKFRN